MNYELEMQNIIKTLKENEKPTLLLHSCCSVCSAHVLSVLTQFFNVTVYFYNPNIHPFDEYERRKKSLEHFLNVAYGGKVALICPEYNEDEFYSAAKGLESEKEGGARCTQCFNLRLQSTAMAAKKAGFQFFTTTLTVSPHKNAQIINEVGVSAQNAHGVQFLPADFKKKDGYKHSTQLAKQYDLYRQNYCGCAFSC